MEQPIDFIEENKVTLNQPGAKALLMGAKWAKFIAIFGIVILGLYVIAALFQSSTFMRYLSTVEIIGWLLYFVLMITVLIWILLFANNAIAAVRHSDSDRLTESMRYLRNLFLLNGILIILLVVGGIVAFVFLMSINNGRF